MLRLAGLSLLLLFISSCGTFDSFTTRKYRPGIFREGISPAEQNKKSVQEQNIVTPPPHETIVAASDVSPETENTRSYFPPISITFRPDTPPGDTTLQKNVLDRFHAKNDSDRAHRSLRSGLISMGGAVAYYFATRPVITNAGEVDYPFIIMMYVVVIPLCVAIGLVALVYAAFSLFHGFKVKKHNKDKKDYPEKTRSTLGILSAFLGIALTILATILLRAL